LGIENRKPKSINFSLSKLASWQQLRKKILKKIIFYFLFFSASIGEGGGEGGGEGRRGKGREGLCASAQTPMPERTLGRVRADGCVLSEVTSKQTLQCVQVTDAPAAIVRPSVRSSVIIRVTTLIHNHMTTSALTRWIYVHEGPSYVAVINETLLVRVRDKTSEATK
jgi:hypothetical protein